MVRLKNKSEAKLWRKLPVLFQKVHNYSNFLLGYGEIIKGQLNVSASIKNIVKKRGKKNLFRICSG